MRKLNALILATLALAFGALPAAAAGPDHDLVVINFPDGVFQECDGFDILMTDSSVQRRSQTWTDANGQATLTRFHVQFDFTLTNSVTGTTGTYTGQFNRVLDFVANTVTFNGVYRKLQIDGRNVLSASGHTVFDDNAMTKLVRGHGDIDEWHELVCGAMDR